MNSSTQARREYEASLPKTAIELEKETLQTKIVPEVEKLQREAESAKADLRSAAAEGSAAYQDGLGTNTFPGNLRGLLEEAGRVIPGVDKEFADVLGNINGLEALANFPNVRTGLHNCPPRLRALVGRLGELAASIRREAGEVTARIREKAEANRRAGGSAQLAPATAIVEPERGPAEQPVETEFEMGGRIFGRRPRRG